MRPLFPVALDDRCRHHPSRLAYQFTDGGSPITYGELGTWIRRWVAYLLAHNVRQGDRVAILLSKSHEFIGIHLATQYIGVISLPLNPNYGPHEIEYCLEDSGAKLIITDRSLPPAMPLPIHDIGRLHEAALPAPWEGRIALEGDDPAVMIYTSGTTGRPKGALSSHASLTANVWALHAAWGWSDSDVLLHALPFFHVHGLVVALYTALFSGAAMLIMPKFDLKRCHTLFAQSTIFMGVPTMYYRLVHEAGGGPSRFSLSTMRLFTSGSDRLDDELFEGFKTRYGATILERYGMTETGITLSNPLLGARKKGSVGFPLPGVEARITDDQDQVVDCGTVGQLQIRGATLFLGYWNNEEKTRHAYTRDGWFRTGDLARQDGDGYYYLQGRMNDMIITGGLNVYPAEVERVIKTHPSIDQCAVIGKPDPEWGQRLVAYIVPRDKGQFDPATIHTFITDKLASYKRPQTYRSIDELPRNAMGKVQKQLLPDP